MDYKPDKLLQKVESVALRDCWVSRWNSSEGQHVRSRNRSNLDRFGDNPGVRSKFERCKDPRPNFRD